MLSHYLCKVKVQICGKLRTRWSFSWAVVVSVGIWKLGLRDLIFVHPGVKINGSYSWVVHFFGTQYSFEDEIKLNYSLANTTIQYVRVAIWLCTVSVKCLSVNYSDTTTSRSGRRKVRPNQTNLLDPPLYFCQMPALSVEISVGKLW